MPKPKRIVGDPLTGSLPVTRLVVPQDSYGPVRVRRQAPPQWPLVPDPMAVTLDSMIPGRVAYVRTRFGIRSWQIRVVLRSTEPGKNRGRNYLVGHDRKGWCHVTWADQVIRVESARQALSTAIKLKALNA